MPEALVSIGVAAALGPDTIAAIAPAVESAGFHALWVNDTPGADALAALAAAAAVTDRLTLATGVVPMDRRPPESIADAVRALPQDRLVLGIGSGAARSGVLALMRESVRRLREVTSARVLIGALGPRMRRLGAAEADGVLLSWLTPEAAKAQAAEAHAAGPAAQASLYVRAALDPDAVQRLEEEAGRYGGFPQYRANFERLGIAPGATVLRPDDFGRGIREYRSAVDEVVLRAIVAEDDVAAYTRFIETAASSV